MKAARVGWAAAIAAGVLAGGQAAHGGGTNVAIAATANRVWVTAGSRVIELDATSGRVRSRVPTRYPYPLALALSDGNVWAASVANGFVSAAVSLIPFDGPRASTPLVERDRPVYDLAVTSEATWALVGPWHDLRLARIDHSTRRVARFDVRDDVAWLAGDSTGRLRGLVALTRSGDLVRIDDRGTPRPLAAVAGAAAPPAVAFGSIWVPTRSSLLRVDGRTGRTLGRVSVPHALSVTSGGGFVWALEAGLGSLRLVKIDPHGPAIAGRATLPARSGALTYGNEKLWLGTTGARLRVLEIDPRTLEARVFATVH